MRTRLSICRRKRRFATADAAINDARRTGLPLRPYACDRCGRFHLTSRTRGKWLPATLPPADDGEPGPA